MNSKFQCDKPMIGHSKGESSHQTVASETTADDAFFMAATKQTHIRGLRDIGIQLNSQRRAASKPIRGAASAWIDLDDSGTYDPKRPDVNPLSHLPRRAKKTREGTKNKSANIDNRATSHRPVGYGFLVTLTLTSKAGLDYLRSITPGSSETEATGVSDGVLEKRAKKASAREFTTPSNPGSFSDAIAEEGFIGGTGGLRKRTQRSRAPKEKPGKKASKRSSRPDALLPSKPIPGSSHGIDHIFIQTAFAHPISFNHIPAPNGNAPCSWCTLPLFGLFGHGIRKVEVLPCRGGHGFEEVANDPKLQGHNQRGEERSRMCVSCTFARVRAMACVAHDMRPLEDVDPEVFDSDKLEAAVQALASGDAVASHLVREARWCAICPAIAEHRCCTPQGTDVSLPDVGEGCGLFLCEICRDLLENIEKQEALARTQDLAILDRLVQMVDADRFMYPLGARPDATFLTKNGELSVRIAYGMGQDAEDSPLGREL